jgi:hypothetical protein
VTLSRDSTRIPDTNSTVTVAATRRKVEKSVDDESVSVRLTVVAYPCGIHHLTGSAIRHTRSRYTRFG